MKIQTSFVVLLVYMYTISCHLAIEIENVNNFDQTLKIRKIRQLGGGFFNSRDDDDKKSSPGLFGSFAQGIGSTGGNVLNTVQKLTESFDSFSKKFNKVYKTVEEATLRKNIFSNNLKVVDNLQKDYASGKLSFRTAINHLSDLLPEEFNNAYNGFNRKNRGKPKPKPKLQHKQQIDIVQVPEQIDWREKGAVTSVKNQKGCSSCFAFSATGALEGQIFRKKGVLVDLSMQNLIDCTKKYDNSGCRGGLMSPSFEYVRDNHGIELETNYPFEANDTFACRYKQSYKVGEESIYNKNYIDIDEGDEKQLEAAVATIGPVSAAIDGNLTTFQHYAGEVYYDPECHNNAEKMNHAVLIVGYGKQADGTKYWIVKNSYGPTWGENGYIKMAKNKNNACGIATYASYPVF